MVEVEADAATSGRVSRHAPKARKLGKRGRERTRKRRQFKHLIKSKQTTIGEKKLGGKGEKDRNRNIPAGRGRWKRTHAAGGWTQSVSLQWIKLKPRGKRG
jgi:hypothetical protein